MGMHFLFYYRVLWLRRKSPGKYFGKWICKAGWRKNWLTELLTTLRLQFF